MSRTTSSTRWSRVGSPARARTSGWAELLLDLSSWPQGTHALCRRERPHPGAQLTLSDAEGPRLQVMLTNQKGKRIARLEQMHKQRLD